MSEWKLKYRVFRITCQAMGPPEIDLFAFRHSQQILMEARPTLPSGRGTAAKVEPKMHLSPQSPGANIDNPGLAFVDVIPRPFAFNEKYTFSPNKREINKSKGTCSSSGKKRDFTASHLENVRASLYDEGVSKGACDLIIAFRMDGTNSNYSLSWKKWTNWCIERQINRFQCPLNHVPHLLGFLFEPD